MRDILRLIWVKLFPGEVVYPAMCLRCGEKMTIDGHLEVIVLRSNHQE